MTTDVRSTPTGASPRDAQASADTWGAEPALAGAYSTSPPDSSAPHAMSSAPSSAPHAMSSAPYAASGPHAMSSAPYAASGPHAMSTSQLDRDEPLSSADVGATDADLRDAVGAKSSDKSRASSKKRARTAPPDLDSFDDDDTAGRPRSRKTIIVAILSLIVGLGVAALIFLGRANSAYFYLSCEPDKIVAEQGRSFPPWGESTLGGKQWAAIKIPPEAECIPLETEDEAELSNQFRTMLVKRASVLLTAKEVTKTDEASALLEQALLHARSNTDAARDARTEIQRLLGDVVYWRASLKLRDASKALLEAAKQFDTAAQQRPRHVSDASAWAEYVRKVAGDLEAGPSGSTQASFPPTPQQPATEPRQPAPPGVALPVEPDQGSASEPPPAAPPDAGLPTGGVLL